MMSIRYLYVIQRDEEPTTVTVFDFLAPQTTVRDVKFMVMHCGADIVGTISKFLTKGGYLFNQSHSFHAGAIISETFKIGSGNRFPLNEMYLVLGPLQSEVMVKLQMRSDVGPIMDKIDTISKNIEVNDKLFANVVNENRSLRSDLVRVTSTVDELRGIISGMSKDNESLRSYVKQLTESVKEQTECMQSLGGDIKEMSEDCQNLREDCQNLRDDCQNLRDDNENLRGDNQLLSDYNKELWSMVGTLSESVDDLKTTVAGIREDIDKKAFINGSYFDDTGSETGSETPIITPPEDTTSETPIVAEEVIPETPPITIETPPTTIETPPIETPIVIVEVPQKRWGWF
jgi:uncharacterized protein YoxC